LATEIPSRTAISCTSVLVIPQPVATGCVTPKLPKARQGLGQGLVQAAQFVSRRMGALTSCPMYSGETHFSCTTMEVRHGLFSQGWIQPLNHNDLVHRPSLCKSHAALFSREWKGVCIVTACIGLLVDNRHVVFASNALSTLAGESKCCIDHRSHFKQQCSIGLFHLEYNLTSLPFNKIVYYSKA